MAFVNRRIIFHTINRRRKLRLPVCPYKLYGETCRKARGCGYVVPRENTKKQTASNVTWRNRRIYESGEEANGGCVENSMK
jgi:hypothetical protein